MAKQQQLEIPVLSAEAAAAFDRYVASGEKKRTADATGRRQGEIKAEALDAVLEAMGDSPLARLPDGRLINREQKVQERRAQKAKTVEWWELKLVE